MNSLRPLQWVGIALGVALALYLLYPHLQDFGDITFLGGILLIEVIIAALWKYEQRFFLLLMITFIWAGMPVVLQSAWTTGRWVVLAAGAVVGFIVWVNSPRSSFRSIHLIAFFCVCAAFTSATVSPWIQMASLKALSLTLLFLYCVSGARLAVLGREERFFRGLVFGCEVAVFLIAIFYLGMGTSVLGNPNALGGTMSIGPFPILLWGWLTAEGVGQKAHRLLALLLCVYLVFFSMARAGIVSMSIVALIFCFCLRQYKLLAKVAAIALFLVAITGMFAPQTLTQKVADMQDAVLYKGHKDEGVLGSRRSPWEKTIASIKEHPWFGTGYGTSPTGEDPGFDFGRNASSAETAREHGSSYMTITEWVGLVGLLPFVGLLGVTASNVWRTCTWMLRTANPRHYSIPLAMVVLSGLAHASFEDWLFAAGAYPCVFFWVCAFLLADLTPTAEAATARLAYPTSRFAPVRVGAVVYDR